MIPRNHLLAKVVVRLLIICTVWTLLSCAAATVTPGAAPTPTPVPAFLLDSPYSGGVQYKGQLHAHSTRSDGEASPAAMLSYYQNRGYKFIALTDHDISCRDIYTDPGVPGILYIPSEEDGLHVETHLLAVGLTRHEAPCGPGEETTWSLQRRISHVNNQGSIAVLAHPFWRSGSWGPLLEENVCALRDFYGLEIANHDDQLGGNARAIALWDEMLTAGRRLWGFAVDDAHSLNPPGINRGWIMVNSLRYADVLVDSSNLAHEVPDQQDILDSIKRGRFFAVTRTDAANPGAAPDDSDPIVVIGTSGRRITVLADQLAINQADAVIRFIGQNGRLLVEYAGPPAGNYLVGGFYDCNGSEGYVRVEVELKKADATYVIYSQPIFVADADDMNQGVEGVVHHTLTSADLTFTRREPSCGSAPIYELITGDGQFHLVMPSGSYEYTANDGYYEAKGEVGVPLKGFVDLDIRMTLKPGTREPP